MSDAEQRITVLERLLEESKAELARETEAALAANENAGEKERLLLETQSRAEHMHNQLHMLKVGVWGSGLRL